MKTTTATTTTNIAVLDDRLNQGILQGKALELFEELYHDDVVMTENGTQVTRGKEANREREEQFFGSITELHELSLGATAVQGDRSFSEWVFDVTFDGGARKRLVQVAVRDWRDGKIAEERFYYDPS